MHNEGNIATKLVVVFHAFVNRCLFSAAQYFLKFLNYLNSTLHHLAEMSSRIGKEG